ncbi:MAG: hypothetical protein NTY65_03115 [Planctomycetota bacterium]|nr:hypothetical protein [Planctomycetota bacterium]
MFFVLLWNDFRAVGAALWLQSNHRFLAEKVLMREAARYGLPAADIAKSSGLCRRFLAKHPRLCVQGAAWPTCLSAGVRRKLSPREQNIIDRAEDVLLELEAKAELYEAGGKAAGRRKIGFRGTQ